jgi:hypothetical protein
LLSFFDSPETGHVRYDKLKGANDWDSNTITPGEKDQLFCAMH